MTFATTASFFRHLLRLGRWGEGRALRDTVDPAEMGTAFGLESTMLSEDDTPLVQRLSAADRLTLGTRHR